MPRVLHIVQSGDGGGVQRHVHDLVTGLPDQTAGVVTGTEGWLTRTIRDTGLPVRQAAHLVRSLDPRNVAAARRELAEVCRDWTPGVVHAHGIFALLAALPLADQMPLVYTGHGFQWHDKAHPWGLRSLSLAIHHRAAPRVAAFVAIASEADEALRVGFQRVEQIPNGVRPWDAGVRLDNSKTFGVATRLVPGKGLESLLDILAAEPDLQLCIAGDGSLAEHLAQKADVHGYRDRVDFLGWQDDLRLFYGGLFAYVSLSRKEGLPYGVLDALGAGLPVVLSDIAGHRELVAEGRNGYLVPQGDVTATLSALRRLASDRAHCTTAGAASRSLVEEHFSLDQMLGRHAELYTSLRRAV